MRTSLPFPGATCPRNGLEQMAQAPKFFRQWMGPLESYATPLPSRAPRAHSGQVIVPKGVDEPGLF